MERDGRRERGRNERGGRGEEEEVGREGGEEEGGREGKEKKMK